jgi:hypothetical protein
VIALALLSTNARARASARRVADELGHSSSAEPAAAGVEPLRA